MPLYSSNDTHGLDNPVVLLDGLVIREAVLANTDEGWVEALAKDANDQMIIEEIPSDDPNVTELIPKIKTVRKNGEVVVLGRQEFMDKCNDAISRILIFLLAAQELGQVAGGLSAENVLEDACFLHGVNIEEFNRRIAADMERENG